MKIKVEMSQEEVIFVHELASKNLKALQGMLLLPLMKSKREEIEKMIELNHRLARTMGKALGH